VFKSFQKYFLNLLFPISCLKCHQPETVLCSNCLKTIKQTDLQVCPLCEKAITLNGEVCRPCQQRFNPALNRLIVSANYKNKLLAKAIHLFKYKFIKDFSEPLAQLMINSSEKLTIPVPDYLLPIPLHPRRLRWRGFNQAELLTQELSEKLLVGLKIPILGNNTNQLIIRHRHTKPQKDIKNYSQRQANLKNIFKINNSFSWERYNLSTKNLAGKNILIVDDVSTTGSTIFNYAQELKKLNPKSISAIILGRQH
jgi:ComF family protein